MAPKPASNIRTQSDQINCTGLPPALCALWSSLLGHVFNLRRLRPRGIKDNAWAGSVLGLFTLSSYSLCFCNLSGLLRRRATWNQARAHTGQFLLTECTKEAKRLGGPQGGGSGRGGVLQATSLQEERGKNWPPAQGPGRKGQDCLSSLPCCCMPFPLQGGQRTAGPARTAAEQWAQGSLTPSRALGF